jgi:hypothetical protein
VIVFLIPKIVGSNPTPNSKGTVMSNIEELTKQIKEEERRVLDADRPIVIFFVLLALAALGFVILKVAMN